MDSEERPLKIRKIQETDDSEAASVQSSESSPEIILDQAEQDADHPRRDTKDQNGQSKKDAGSQEPPLSKNAQKRLARRKAWDEAKDYRRQKRKEKQVVKRVKRRLERAEAAEAASTDGHLMPDERSKRTQPINIPMTFLVDCGFDEQMSEKEIISLSAQVTRCYSENRKAVYRPQMAISSFNARLRTRYETTLQNPHIRWANFHVDEGDFVDVAEKGKARMLEISAAGLSECVALTSKKDSLPEDGEIIYLTADSDDTLEELRPYSTYIIGGIVDRNRHKGICYKRARDRNIKTAKLPIGEFMQMNSRAVLATNHVYEIMLKWLELKDWGEAFLKVIPKRKGGVLKNAQRDTEEQHDGKKSVQQDEEDEDENDVVHAADNGHTAVEE